MTASVLLGVIWPAARLVRARSAPAAPTLTVLVALAPAKPEKVTAPIVAELVDTVAAVVEYAPSATSLLFAARLWAPSAMEL